MVVVAERTRSRRRNLGIPPTSAHAPCLTDMRIAEFSVPAGAMAPATIRRALDEVALPSSDLRSDLRLLASELATSPALVGRDRDATTLTIRVSREGARTRLEIEALRERSPAPADSGDPPEHRGPPLLERVCQRWGMSRAAAAVTIWFEVADSPAPAPTLCPLPAPDSPLAGAA